MDIFVFYKIVSAVLVGNALTVLVAYTVWRASKLERRGIGAKFLPLPLLLATLVPFAIVVISVASLG